MESIRIGEVISFDFFENHKYVVNKVLYGGMGKICQLVSVRSGSSLAMKTFLSTTDKQAFQRECEIWLSLGSHPNIARVVSYGAWRGQPVILVDWYPQTMVETVISGWETTALLKFAQSLIGVLLFAYERTGLVHQDIKPANILLDAESQVRLSDFGLARCSAGPHQPRPDRGATIVDINLPTISGPFGGTPPYMAPELFIDAMPTLQTDIYSLGVTLYQILTSEHPYIGAETGWRFSPTLRHVGLDRELNRRGVEIEPLIELIADCLNLDPSGRPQDYATMLSKLRTPTGKKSESQPEEFFDDVITLAAYYRRQQRFAEANTILQNALDTQPEDPRLLNALGALFDAEGQKTMATTVFEQATSVLMENSGVWMGALYLDPIINLANSNLNGKKFVSANRILEAAWSFVNTEETGQIRFLFAEFAWMWLYEGKFSKCSTHLIQVLRHKAPDRAALWWLTESAWLGDEMSQLAETLGRYFLATQPLDVPTILCACLVAAHAPAILRQQMLSLINERVAAEIEEIERGMKLQPSGLRPPFNRAVECLIVRSLDQKCTGGKHSGLIR